MICSKILDKIKIVKYLTNILAGLNIFRVNLIILSINSYERKKKQLVRKLLNCMQPKAVKNVHILNV